MEKFEINGEKNLEVFSGFVGKTKLVFNTLLENVKSNIKIYEAKIENTSKEISDNEISREKCEKEIEKMEAQIETIKDAIENVESTYQKMVDAYSSTSKGETKELYSEIMNSAKANCEKDVEKNRSEIARLNSDIEAIKNNIAEFTKVIDGLNKDLEGYNTELFRFTKGLEYVEKISEKTMEDLKEISTKKDTPVKKAEPKTAKKNEIRKAAPKSKPEEKDGADTEGKTLNKRPSVLDTFETESFDTTAKETTKKESKTVIEEKTQPKELSFEESLRQIYDLTGYKPTEKTVEEEPKKEENKVDQPVYKDNLEGLFTTPSKDVELEKKDISPINDDEFSNWESILNTTPLEEAKEESKPVSIEDNMEDTANQLLAPYGTSVKRLKSLVSGEITYKDGHRIAFDMTSEDIIKAVNSVDGTDLKAMKTVGPEVTLLRRVKDMKEGNR